MTSPFEPTPAERAANEEVKRATQLSNEKRWDEAIETLRAALAVLARGNMSYPIKLYCRLPAYLQYAGRYDEAVTEFERLLDSVPARMDREMAHVSATERQRFSEICREDIHHEWVAVKKREEKRIRKLAR